jgi:hypothetical protein
MQNVNPSLEMLTLYMQLLTQYNLEIAPNDEGHSDDYQQYRQQYLYHAREQLLHLEQQIFFSNRMNKSLLLAPVPAPVPETPPEVPQTVPGAPPPEAAPPATTKEIEMQFINDYRANELRNFTWNQCLQAGHRLHHFERITTSESLRSFYNRKL